jgi:C-terminal processing protease CtpA/Prc
MKPHARWVQAAIGTVLALGLRAADGQDLTPLVRDQTYVMLRDVKGAIEQNYYDSKFSGVDLGAQADVAQARIAKATSLGEAFAAIAQFELELNDSHTFFIPPRLTIEVDYGWEMRLIGDRCYIVRVNPRSDAAQQGVAPGDLVRSVNGFQPGRENLWRIDYLFKVLRAQPGLHVELTTPSGMARKLDLAAEVHKHKRTLDITGHGDTDDITRVLEQAEKEWQKRQPVAVESGDIMIFRLPSFTVDEKVIAYNLSRARDHAALILDLRGNRGGPVAILQRLVGGLSATDISLATERERHRSETLVAKGAGGSAFTGRLFVLIDSASASASELLARTIQLAERGTVIGDRSAGAVMVSRIWPLEVGSGESVILYGSNVTVADVVMPDGGRLETTGVVPDVTVLPTAQDLQAGRDPALARALTMAGKPTDAAAAGALLPAK